MITQITFCSLCKQYNKRKKYSILGGQWYVNTWLCTIIAHTLYEPYIINIYIVGFINNIM